MSSTGFQALGFLSNDSLSKASVAFGLHVKCQTDDSIPPTAASQLVVCESLPVDAAAPIAQAVAEERSETVGSGRLAEAVREAEFFRGQASEANRAPLRARAFHG